MKKSLLTRGAIALAALLSIQTTTVVASDAIETPYMETFTDSNVIDDWTVIDVNEDGYTWSCYAGKVTYPYNSSKAANDWLITPKLAIGEGLKLVFDVASGNASWYDSYSVHVLTSPDDIENAVCIRATTDVLNTLYETQIIDISSYAGQEIYIGFRADSQADRYYLHMDNIGVIAPSYDIYAVASGEGEVSINGAATSYDQSASIPQGDSVTFTAVAYEGYEFLSWSDATGTDISTANPYVVESTMANMSLTANFGLAEARAISLAVNNPDIATVSFVSPTTTETTISTKQEIVSITTSPIGTDSFFLNWTDAEGNEYSDDEDITYSEPEAVSLTANYELRYIVTSDDGPGGGTIKITTPTGEIESGDRVIKGNAINIKLNPLDAREVKTFTVDGVDVLDSYDATEGYDVVVDAAVSITATFGFPDLQLSYTTTGAGYLEVWSGDDGNPTGTHYTNSGLIPYGDPLYIFPYSYNDSELISIIVDGEDMTAEFNEGVDEGYLSLEVYPYDDLTISVAFTGTSTGVEDATTAKTSVYGAQGAIVVDGAGVATIYSLTGSVVKATKLSGKSTIDMPQGVYIVTIGGKSYKAIVK